MTEMKNRLMAWTPVALSSDLPKGSVFRTFVEGRDLAVWRSHSGAVRAWDNRCPHRGMRLSFGFVRGESLTCIYHGWQYGTDGVCRYIPAHPDLKPPATLCTSAFACVERVGLIFAALSEPKREPVLDVTDAEPVRSLVFEQELAEVRSMLGETEFPITEAWKPKKGSFTTIRDGDGLIIREGRMARATRQLIAALQSLPDDRTMVHILTSPHASSSLKTLLSRRLEHVRRIVENPEAKTPSWRPAEALTTPHLQEGAT